MTLVDLILPYLKVPETLEIVLGRLSKMEGQQMADRAALDAALAAERDEIDLVVGAVAVLNTHVLELQAKIDELGTPVDFQAELDAVTQDTATLAGLLPAPEPVPTP